jgi:hypothetical protein
MSIHNNNGVATPTVRLLTKLPKTSRDVTVANFDMSAHSFNALKASPVLSPLLMDHVSNPEGTFAVCFPSKRKTFADNIMKDASVTTPPDQTIIWTPVGPPAAGEKGIITEYIKDLPSYYADIETTNPQSRIPLNITQFKELGDGSDAQNNYKGPIWAPKTYTEQPQPDDTKIAREFFNGVVENDEAEDASGGSTTATATSSTSSSETVKNCVDQTIVADGLWWGVESNDFLEKNMPFWITLEKPKRPPVPAEHETVFIISLGIDSTENTDRYDIVLGINKKPVLIDYYGDNEIIRTFEGEASRVLTTNEQIDIGVMTSGGRLIIFVNGSTLVYTRTVKTGADDSISTIKEANIDAGKIRIYGTNLSCLMYTYPMTFARYSALAFPIPTSRKSLVAGAADVPIRYSAPDEFMNPSGKPVCILPQVAGVVAGTTYGVDSKRFRDHNGTIVTQPSFGLHLEGFANFISAEDITSNYSSLPNTGFFLLSMRPENRQWLNLPLKYSKTPYFFRIKGVDSQEKTIIANVIEDVTEDVISIKETSSAPDYFHLKKQATFTLYNTSGKYNNLRNKQFGIDIAWGWNGTTKRTFTGMSVSTSSSEIAGKETLTVQCEDYNYILQNTPIVNSPYYDGMVGYHAVKNLAERAGISEFERDWDDHETFFLPSGYSFSSPQMRFKSTDKIFDCIMGIVKRFEAYTYFDGMGKMHIDKLPGGLLGEVSPLVASVEFTSDPTETNKVLILENKNIDIDLKSTVNHISVLTLDRDNRNPIFFGFAALPPEYVDILAFKKKMMIDQPAYGEISVARSHAKELAKRVFKPIRKTSFKTVGVSTTVIEPLAFITVDGIFFRLISLSRDFNAETNDFVQNYECEWLNG